MNDPKERKYEPEAPTMVPGVSAPARRAAVPVQTPPPVTTGSAFASSPESPTLAPSGSTSMTPPPGSELSGGPGSTWGGVVLQAGTVLANRYEIVRILGEGGMGAVYEARDLELERAIALKVIRPELASDPEILQRFKQELILARQVSHRNVIRIFDLGEAGKIKFITMEYVDGEALHQILRERGKLEPAEAVHIMEQAACGLAAIHSEGIIHRDLKPGNIMRDRNGRVVVMDFGLARSFAGDGMTRSGAMLGTIEYMSPEQAQGGELKASSDIFTVGLILYELLSGVMPFKAESAIASLLKRTQQRATPLTDVDRKIPGVLSNIVSKCLEKDPAHRYQSAEQLVADLHTWQGRSGRSKVSASGLRLRVNRLREMPWFQIGGAAAIMIGTVIGLAWYLNRRAQPVRMAHAPVSVLVGDFQNDTGDPIFSDTLEPMMNIALEGANFVSAFNRGTARNVAQKLPHPTSTLDEQTARLIAISQGIGDVITGSLSRRGNGYELSVQALDATTGNVIASSAVSAATKDDLLLAIPKLAVPIRKALGDRTPASAQLDAARGPFTAASLEVVHLYGQGMEQQVSGNMEGALKSFSQAVQLDPNFTRAYAGMASVEGNLGQTQAAERDIRLAMEHVDRMTERERYRVRGLYYARTGDWQDCIQEYSELVKQFPADDVGHNNLAFCYKSNHNTPKAIDELKQTLAILPKNQIVRTNLAIFAAYVGDARTAQAEAQQILRANSSYEKAYVALAYAQVEQGNISQAVSSYQQLQKVSPLGQSLAAPGLADIAFYQGRYKDADRFLEDGARTDLKSGRADSAAADLVALAEVRLLQEQKAAALQALQQALASSKSTSVRFRAGRVYAAAGDAVRARQVAAQLASEAQPEPQAFAKLIDGEAALQGGDARKAIEIFQGANNQLDTWLGHFDLGRAYLRAGLFVQADSEFDHCLDRSGETLDLFDYVPTYGYVPDVYYYQGKARQGMNSPGFIDSYAKYLSIRGAAGEDPLLAEVRHGMVRQERN